MSTGTVRASPDNKQLLDRLPVERERGITVKAQTATMLYSNHMLNLIDTPVSTYTSTCTYMCVHVHVKAWKYWCLILLIFKNWWLSNIPYSG